jgi:ABC-type multidrug transport system fused ATPase/permease subunit
MPAQDAPPAPPSAPSFWFTYFFRNTEKFFVTGATRQLKENDIPNLPKPMQVPSTINEVSTAREAVDTKAAEARLRAGQEDHRPEHDHLDLKGTVTRIIMKPLKEATLLRIAEQAGGVAIASIFKLFATSMKKDHTAWSTPFFWILVGSAVTLFRGLCNEHSMLRVCAMKAKTGQILRGLLFKRLQNLSYITLDKMNSATMSKMLDYEFGILANWIGLVPAIVTAPFTLSLATWYLYTAVGVASTFFLGIFVVLTFIISWLHNVNAGNLNAFIGQAADRGALLNEMLPNMKEVKTSCYERYFRINFENIRKTENVSLRKVQVVNTLIQFFLELMPLICTFAIIVFYNFTHPQPLSTVGTFTVVTLLGMLQGPLGVLSNISRDRQLFNDAYRHVYAFLNTFDARPTESYLNARIEKGRIEFSNASFAINAGQEKRKVKKIMSLDDSSTPTPVATTSYMPWAGTMRKIKKFLGSEPKKPEEDPEPDTKEVLKNCTTNITAGQKVCLIGTEGGGRSMFMLSIMGETNKCNGSLHYNGKISYLNMKAPLWLVGESLQENILVGEQYDHKRFQRI